MQDNDGRAILRGRDFWGALGLAALSVFFLWKTSAIPLFGENRAGVSGADWYNSAAVVPFGIFGALLLLSLSLLAISIKAGGAKRALTAVGIGLNPDELHRFGTIAIMLTAYIAGLVPRVDFILSSGLLITALVYAYHGGHKSRARISALVMLAPAAYALIANLPQSAWGNHDDDWLTLAAWLVLTGIVLWYCRGDRVLKVLPALSVIAPTLLVCAMAFGFRQNVPARTGLIFQQIEYLYYVVLRPLWMT